MMKISINYHREKVGKVSKFQESFRMTISKLEKGGKERERQTFSASQMMRYLGEDDWNLHRPRFFFLFKFKWNNDNDLTFCYFSCLGRYCFQPLFMAALPAQAAADACLEAVNERVISYYNHETSRSHSKIVFLSLCLFLYSCFHAVEKRSSS